MTRILFVITGLSTGGAEKMLYKLLQRIDRTRFDCRVVSLTDYGTVGLEISKLGIDVVALNLHRVHLVFSALWQLMSILRNWKPDVTSTWLYHADLIGGVLAWFHGVRRIIWNIRNTTLIGHGRFRLTQVVVKICALLSRFVPSEIIVNSSRAMNLHIDLGYESKKMCVIPNGFETDIFKPNEIAKGNIRREHGISMTAPVIGLFGRYDRQKNHAGFIEAAEIVFKTCPNVIFLMVGRNINHSNAELMSFILSRNLENNFILADERSDMASYCSAIDWLCLPSLGESFPNVLGEAMSAGVPCVVSDVGDCAYIIGENGLIVPPGNTESLARALISALGLSSTERIRLGQGARQRIIDQYSIETVVAQYETLFTRAAED